MSFPPATEMFQFTGFASHTLCIQIEMTLRVGFPIRKSADQSLLAAPHGLSQRATSFIASWCQGIHQMPFLTLDQLTHGKTSDVVLTFIHVKDALICSRELYLTNVAKL